MFPEASCGLTDVSADFSRTQAYFRGCMGRFRGYQGVSGGFRVGGCCMSSQKISGGSRSVSGGFRILHEQLYKFLGEL